MALSPSCLLQAVIANKTPFASPSLQRHYIRLPSLEAAFILHCFWLSGVFIKRICSFSNLSNTVKMLALQTQQKY